MRFHSGDLPGQVIIKPAQESQFRQGLIGLRQRPQGMRHGARGLGDNGRIPGIGLGLTGMEIGDAAHGQSRQIGDLKAFCARYRDRQGAYRGGLIDNEQERAVYGESGDQRSQLLFIIWQRLIQQPLARSIQGYGMVRPLSHIHADKDTYTVRAFMVCHTHLPYRDGAYGQ